jgi:hypothetical protein
VLGWVGGRTPNLGDTLYALTLEYSPSINRFIPHAPYLYCTISS